MRRESNLVPSIWCVDGASGHMNEQGGKVGEDKGCVEEGLGKAQIREC